MLNLPTTMPAVRVHEFGGIEQMALEQVAVPEPGPDQVLIDVHAAGVGPWDGWVRQGKSAFDQPLPLTPGADLSGQIVAIGPSVEGYKAGDAVFGVTNPKFTGGYARYALAESRMIAPKPAGLGFVEAAALPVVAVTAWTMVCERSQIADGDRVLIHGGAGNVGAYAVQLAKRLGAFVIATALHADTGVVATLGADHVIDVNTTDFVAECGAVDLVIDTVGGESQRRSFDVLRPGGRLVSSVSEPDSALASSRQLSAQFFIVNVTRERLEAVTSRRPPLRVLVGEVLQLQDFRLAHQMLEGRAHRAGKIVLNVAG